MIGELSMLRWIAAICLVLAPATAQACTFCAGSALSRQTFREYLHDSKFVAYGMLSDPKPDPSGLKGTTKFAPSQLFKGTAPAGALVIPRYLPLIGRTPADYLVFGTVDGSNVEPLYGVTATAPMLAYLQDVAKLSKEKERAAERWKFYFEHLDAADPAVAADAFLEFAKAPDAEIAGAKAIYSTTKLRRLMTDPNLPADRLGVFALMLGMCGTTEDERFLEKSLTAPLSDRVQPNVGGYLAGLTALNPTAGWTKIEAWAADAKRPYAERLSAVGTMHYFQAVKPTETKPQVLKVIRALLAAPELADLAVEDLRRWGWWDETSAVLGLWMKPTHGGRLIRRAVVQYALVCPNPECKAFIATVRRTDAKLVATVEELLQIDAENRKP